MHHIIEEVGNINLVILNKKERVYMFSRVNFPMYIKIPISAVLFLLTGVAINFGIVFIFTSAEKFITLTINYFQIDRMGCFVFGLLVGIYSTNIYINRKKRET